MCWNSIYKKVQIWSAKYQLISVKASKPKPETEWEISPPFSSTVQAVDPAQILVHFLTYWGEKELGSRWWNPKTNCVAKESYDGNKVLSYRKTLFSHVEENKFFDSYCQVSGQVGCDRNNNHSFIFLDFICFIRSYLL
jgi:hypothetical protein